MKIEINTTSKRIVLTNMILARAVEEMEASKKLRDFLDINEKDVLEVKKFRQDLLKSFLK